ncbi:hypothetical protein [Thiobacillus sp.]|uniref:hypothetical protein n=1 Tax=Thiobacillus sp. TaxID=924 RepID=UPI0025FB412B|nr:hypothetical protein [Thiobacillus sp.]MBT9538934.1 hypothetical protein [Thiobacillus sp.]
MNARIASLALVVALLGSCTYYQTAPGTYSTTPVSSFDRSWGAAQAALADQGVPVARADRAAGVVSGTRDGITVTANVRTQADGSVRVEFRTDGATSRDPDLINRVIAAYNRNMGR